MWTIVYQKYNAHCINSSALLCTAYSLPYINLFGIFQEIKGLSCFYPNIPWHSRSLCTIEFISTIWRICSLQNIERAKCQLRCTYIGIMLSHHSLVTPSPFLYITPWLLAWTSIFITYNGRTHINPTCRTTCRTNIDSGVLYSYPIDRRRKVQICFAVVVRVVNVESYCARCVECVDHDCSSESMRVAARIDDWRSNLTHRRMLQ